MSYFVKIMNPREFRRDVLEASRLLIGDLQSSRSVLVLREQKKRLLASLRGQLQELELLIAKLDDLLPEKELRNEPIPQDAPPLPEPQKPADEKEEPLPSPVPEQDEEQRLQAALASIEKKLSSL